jgi:hypothetical protein
MNCKQAKAYKKTGEVNFKTQCRLSPDGLKNNLKISVRTANNLARIRSDHLPNTSLDCQQYNNMRDEMKVHFLVILWTGFSVKDDSRAAGRSAGSVRWNEDICDPFPK